MDSAKSAKRHCFTGEDDGLASLADMKAGFSGNHHNYPLVSRPLYYSNNNNMRRRSSLRNISSLSSSAFAVCSPRSAAANSTLRFYEESHQAHFLDACFLCKKPLGGNKDIFMYRGDTPFCSEECRQEQIEIDETKEKNRNISASMRALRKKDQRKSTSPNKQDCNFRSSTVAAA